MTPDTDEPFPWERLYEDTPPPEPVQRHDGTPVDTARRGTIRRGSVSTGLRGTGRSSSSWDVIQRYTNPFD